MKRVAAVLLLTAFVAVGCAKTETKPDMSQTQMQKDGASTGTKPEQITDARSGSKDAVASKDRSGEMTGETQEGLFKDIHFEFDKYDIAEADKPTLKSIAAWMTKNTAVKLSVEGHCDDRGTNEYNLALGERRAKATRDYLVSLGVPSSRIDTISYGEEKPLCKEQTEECWAKNRRAHFVVIGKAGK